MNIQTRLFSGLVIVFLLLAGCQAKEEFWINPDGSGKETIEFTSTDRSHPMDDLERMLTFSKGVRQWSDVIVKRDGPRFTLHATAYFDDVNSLMIWRDQQSLRPMLTIENGKPVQIVFDANEDRLLESNRRPSPVESGETNEAAATRISRELPRTMSGMSRRYRETRVEIVVHLPGKAEGLVNLEATGDGVRQVIDGERYADAYLKMVSDKARVTRILDAGENPEEFRFLEPVMRQMMIELMWGKPGGIRATISEDARHPRDKALFDYQAEIKKNQLEFAQVVRNAGLIPPMPALNKDNALASLEAEPVELSPTGGLSTVMVHGKTASNYYRMLDGELIEATDEHGKVVLPGLGLLRDIKTDRHHGEKDPDEINHDEAKTSFDLQLNLPRGPQAFKSIKGKFRVIIGDGVEEKDLGMIDFKDGAKGPALGFVFSGARRAAHSEFCIEMDRSVAPLRIQITDAAGVQLCADGDVEIEMFQGMYSMNAVTVFPEKVHVKVKILKNARIVEVPFEFEDVPVAEIK